MCCGGRRVIWDRRGGITQRENRERRERGECRGSGGRIEDGLEVFR